VSLPNLLPARSQDADGRLLVLPHQATVTFNIGTQNGSEFPFHTRYSIGLKLRDQYHRGKGCQGRQDEINRRINCILGRTQFMSYGIAFGVNNDLGLVNKLMMRVSPEHLRQRRGSVSYTFLMT